MNCLTSKYIAALFCLMLALPSQADELGMDLLRPAGLEENDAKKMLLEQLSEASRALQGQVRLPKAVWTPIEILQEFVPKEAGIQAGFFEEREPGQYWAPVIRDPNIEHLLDMHGRDIYTAVDSNGAAPVQWTLVVKGAGEQEPVRGIPYGYDPTKVYESQQFRGGETLESASHAAEMALKIHQAYQMAVAEEDPVIEVARRKYAVGEAPVLKPLYMLKPLKIPQGASWFDQSELEGRMSIPRKFTDQQIIFVYEVPTNVRLAEVKTHAFSGLFFSGDTSSKLKAFGARLALANHLLHKRLGGTYSKKGENGTVLSSLAGLNITLSGHVVDLDTLTLEASSRAQEQDHHLAIEAIGRLAKYLGIPARVGSTAYYDVLTGGFFGESSFEFQSLYLDWWSELEVLDVLEPLFRLDSRLGLLGRSPVQVKESLKKGSPPETVAEGFEIELKAQARTVEQDISILARQHLAQHFRTLAENAHDLVKVLAVVYGRFPSPARNHNASHRRLMELLDLETPGAASSGLEELGEAELLATQQAV